jgi:hypothetical protein
MRVKSMLAKSVYTYISTTVLSHTLGMTIATTLLLLMVLLLPFILYISIAQPTITLTLQPFFGFFLTGSRRSRSKGTWGPELNIFIGASEIWHRLAFVAFKPWRLSEERRTLKVALELK